MTGYRKRGSGSRSGWGLAMALVIALVGLVALFRYTNAEEGDPTPMMFGIALESAWPGGLLIALAIAVAAWSMRVMYFAGSREPRTEVASWTHQPAPGVKYFGNPPPMPSHKAELAAQGVEAYRMPNGQWGVRGIRR